MDSKIEESKKNFKKWFIGTIDLLCKEEFAGIPLLMISFPLFERYAKATGKDLFQTFCEVFHLHDKKEAIIAWKTFRNGILHKASFNTIVDLTKHKEYMSTELIYQCGVKDDLEKEVHIEQNESMQWTIFISPSKFARKIIELVLANFEEFYKFSENICPLSEVHQVDAPNVGGYSGICDYMPSAESPGGKSGFDESKGFIGHTDSHGIKVDNEMKDSCQSIKIDRYEWKQTYYDVSTSKNNSDRSLKDVEITVILYDIKNNEIDRGIGVIKEILPGHSGNVHVVLAKNKGDFCHHSKISITKCQR